MSIQGISTAGSSVVSASTGSTGLAQLQQQLQDLNKELKTEQDSKTANPKTQKQVEAQIQKQIDAVQKQIDQAQKAGSKTSTSAPAAPGSGPAGYGVDVLV